MIGEQLAPTALVLRLARTMADQRLHGLSEGMALIGEPPSAPVMFLENGLRFEADVIEGQKTGYFLDQRDNPRVGRVDGGGDASARRLRGGRRVRCVRRSGRRHPGDQCRPERPRPRRG